MYLTARRFIPLIVMVHGAGAAISAQAVLREAQTDAVLARAISVRPDQMKPKGLSSLFAAFLAGECHDRPLCQLTVCPDGSQCGVSIPGMFRDFEGPLARHQGNGDWVAHLMKVEDHVAAEVRVGDAVQPIQLGDDRPPVSDSVRFLGGRVVSFSLYTLDEERRRLTRGGVRDSVALYLSMRSRPATSEALRALRELLGNLKLAKGRLYVRHDTFFGPFGGPLCDVTSGCLNLSGVQFEASETLFCWIDESSEGCSVDLGYGRAH